MQFQGEGVAGPNGRDSRSGGTEPAKGDPEDQIGGASGAHGSLMQRYRGSAMPGQQGEQGQQGQPAASGPVSPPLPPLPPPRPPDRSAAPAEEAGATAQAPAASGSLTSGAWGPVRSPAPAAGPAGGPGTASPGTTSPSTSGSGRAAAEAAGSTPVDRPAGAAPAATTAATGTPAGTPPRHEAAGGAADRGATLPDEQSADFRRRWREVQGDFVDDPRQAVRSAEELARDVLGALTAKIADRDKVEGWKAGGGSGTEDLRQSLRQYRTLVDRLLDL
jgi:hypothetical protein